MSLLQQLYEFWLWPRCRYKEYDDTGRFYCARPLFHRGPHRTALSRYLAASSSREDGRAE